MILAIALLTTAAASAPASDPALDPFGPLKIYPGEWRVKAAHPWSGAKPGSEDRLSSRCTRYTAYFACEQTINGKPTIFIVYTPGAAAGTYTTRFIAPDGRAGARGDMVIAGNRWTYTDKPPAGLTGNWSRTVNVVLSHDHIRFEEYESADEGKSWQLTNEGDEWRVSRKPN